MANPESLQKALRQTKTLIADTYATKGDSVVTNIALHIASAVLYGQFLVVSVERRAAFWIELRFILTAHRATALVGYPDIAGAGIQYASKLLLV